MNVKIEIDGLAALTKQLAKISEDGKAVSENAINDTLLETRNIAIKGLQGGPKTGRVYELSNPNRTHQASAPGEYPATDTGRLVSSIGIELATRARLLGTVGTNIEYGPHLEFGTSKMAARPWLLRSFNQAVANVAQRMKAELEARI